MLHQLVLLLLARVRQTTQQDRSMLRRVLPARQAVTYLLNLARLPMAMLVHYPSSVVRLEWPLDQGLTAGLFSLLQDVRALLPHRCWLKLVAVVVLLTGHAFL
jgi:hypothetical protein